MIRLSRAFIALALLTAPAAAQNARGFAPLAGTGAPLPDPAAAPEAAARFGEGLPGLILRGTTDLRVFAPVIERMRESLGPMAPAVLYEQWGSNDLYVREAAACAGRGVASDLIVTSAVDLGVRLVNDGCAQPWRSAATAALDGDSNWRDEIFGVTEEPAVMIWNRDLVPEADAPRSRFDLLDLLRREDGRYAGRIATYDVEASGLGYLFAFMDSRQATTFGGLLEAFGRSGAVATCCSAEILDAVASGRWLIGYNILGSYALKRAEADPRIAVAAPTDYTLVLSRAAMIPRGAPHPAAAGAAVDFLLSPAGRAALQRALLVVDVGAEGTGLAAAPDSADLRPIPLGPALLLGQDRHKRRLFTERWRASLRVAPATGP